MAKADYSEDNNIQEPTAKLFADDLKWRAIYAYNSETFGPKSLLGRKDKTEVVLVRELDKALVHLNKKLAAAPQGQAKLHTARDLLLNADPSKTLITHNQEKWRMIRDGITLKSPGGVASEDVHIRVIDFDTPDENDFLVVRELWIKAGPYLKRCDMIGFVNGLPLVFIELKRHDKGLKAAFDDNYSDYKDTIPQLFHHNALVIVSNGVDARFGSITSTWDHFYRWKRLTETDPDPAPKNDALPLQPLLPILLHGVCAKDALLDIVENFTLFDTGGADTLKVIARNHQLLGVNQAIAKLLSGDADVQAGKLGVFWHTQGSGKSYSMVFFCQKVHRKVSADYTFVLLTDRKELDGQIYATFVACGVSTSKSDKASGADGLENLLRDQNRRYVFSLIHKFHKRVTAPWTPRQNIIVLSDEAHRTQHGRLATQMRMALRSARFMAFTGTPLMDGPERSNTEQVFGRYVSIYDFQRAVADGATLPLSYENRGKKLRIDDPALNARIESRIEAARADGELSEEQEEKLYRELARDYPILTSDTHLDDVATDFVNHYHQRWRLMERPAKSGDAPNYGGNAKALLVCIDKITCVKMVQRIQTKWKQKIVELRTAFNKERASFDAKGLPYTEGLNRDAAQITWMIDTQIHPIFSSAQNEVKAFRAEGIDVGPFREVIAKGIDGKSLEACFKDDRHRFRVAVVCAMWLTGFDVKSLATLYLDKPMKGHTLMQAIARVNRVAANKKNGLVIDYNGMLKSLRAALAIYVQGDQAASGQEFDEEQALAEYAMAIGRVEAHLFDVGFSLKTLTEAAHGAQRNQALLHAQQALCVSADGKKTFQVLAEDLSDRFRGLFPNPGLFPFEPQESAISAIYNLLQKPKPAADIAAIMQDIRGIIDSALDTVPKDRAELERLQYDLSGIDFERLRVEFSKSPYKETALRTMQERIEARLHEMLMENPSRIDLYERYQKIIIEFNRDKDRVEIDRVFDDLLRLNDDLEEEQRRYVREGFHTEEELAVYDLLGKEKDALTRDDIEKIKKVVQVLMATVTERRQTMGRLAERASTQAQLKQTIIDKMLEGMPEEFSNDDISAWAESVFQHMQESQRHWQAARH